MSRQKHRILLYHRIVPDDCPTLFVAMLRGELVTQRIFYQQLLWLKKRYRVVDLPTLLENRSSVEPMAAITFDDGLADNLHLALPVLQQLSIPATIFVIYGSIGRRGFHHHQVARFVSSEGKHAAMSVVDGIHKPRDQLKAVLLHLGEFPDDKLAQSYANVSGTCHEDRFLDDDELRHLDQAGVSIQSHTISHTPLSCLAGDRLKSELLDSKHGLEELLGKQVDYLAYPVGREPDFDVNSMAAALAAGYTAAFTSLSGAVDQHTEIWKIPRLGTRNSVGKLKRKLRPLFPF